MGCGTLTKPPAPVGLSVPLGPGEEPSLCPCWQTAVHGCSEEAANSSISKGCIMLASYSPECGGGAGGGVSSTLPPRGSSTQASLDNGPCSLNSTSPLAIHQNTSNKLYFCLWAERTLATSSITTALTGTVNQLLTPACQHCSECGGNNDRHLKVPGLLALTLWWGSQAAKDQSPTPVAPVTVKSAL